MKKLTLLTICVMAISMLFAQTNFTATYTLAGEGTTEINNVMSLPYNGTAYDGVTPSALQKVGIVSTGSFNNFRGNSWPLGATTGSDVFTGSLDAGKYISFAITPVAGYTFTITSITFGIGRSGTGPRQWQWRGSADSYASAISTYGNVATGLTNASGVLTNPDENANWVGNILNPGTAYQNSATAVEFRLYAYNAEAEGGTAGLQGNITITGTYVSATGVGLAITTPIEGLTVNDNEVAVNFTTSNFVLGTDGKLEYKLNGGAAAYTTTSPFTISGLNVGANTLNFQLVDMSNAALSPAVTATRTVNYVVISTEPGLTITSPTNGATINSQNVNIAFTLANFILGTDGKLAYSLDGNADVFYTGTSPIALTGLTYAAHTVNFRLVDMTNASLSPSVTASLNFTCAEALPGGMEPFDNCNAPAAYGDGSFVGNGGITWAYFHSRDVDTCPINGKGLMLRRGSDSKLEATITGGISSFQVSMRKAFTGASVRKLELYINGELKGTSQEFGSGTGADATVHTFNVPDINVPGTFTIQIKPAGTAATNAQVVIDDISWTSFASTTPYLAISSPANSAVIMDDAVNVVFSVTNFILGTDGKVKYTVDGGTAQYTTASPIALTALADGVHTVALELVDMTNASLSPAVTNTVSFTTNSAGPTYTNIYDIQHTTNPNGESALKDQNVWIRGVVSASFNSTPFTKGYYLQQGGGAWKSVYIFDVTNNPEIGDSVSLYGQVVEFNGMTEVKNVTNFTLIAPYGIVAPATVITATQALTEDFESCLVTIDHAVCTVASMAYGEWKINDGTADFICKDAGAFPFTRVVSTSYKITGVIDYYNYFRLNYRRESDITILSGINSEFANSISLYPNPASSFITIDMPMGGELITITNTLGQVVSEINVNTESMTINTENFNAGLYFVKITNKTDVAVIRFVVE